MQSQFLTEFLYVTTGTKSMARFLLQKGKFPSLGRVCSQHYPIVILRTISLIPSSTDVKDMCWNLWRCHESIRLHFVTALSPALWSSTLFVSRSESLVQQDLFLLILTWIISTDIHFILCNCCCYYELALCSF